MRKKRVDYLRIIALTFVILGIVYFYLNLFLPAFIPYYLRPLLPHRRLNILLLGTDIIYDNKTHSIISESGHTDTMILVNINPLTHKINLLSIPRDTLSEIPGYGYQKINAAHFIGGPSLAKETLKNFLGVTIDNYVVLHPSGLIHLIDLVGGIRLYVDKDMYYVDNWGHLYINLKKGWQTLSGEQAHGFIRYRQDPLGDINRVQRQQAFLKALLHKFSNPLMIGRAPWIIGIAKEAVKTDLTLRNIIEIGNFARMCSKEDIRMIMLPGKFSSEEAERACFWIADLPAAEEIINKYFSRLQGIEKRTTYIPTSYVSIINNSEEPSLAFYIMKNLSKTKYAISNISEVKRDDYTKTQIIAQKGDEAGAKALGKLLKIDEIVVASTGDVTSDYTIIICKDFKDKTKSSL